MYERLDAMIFENIQTVKEASLTQACRGAANDEADRIAKATGREAFRVIDARLQAMRKRGLIRHVAGTWRAA